MRACTDAVAADLEPLSGHTTTRIHRRLRRARGGTAQIWPTTFRSADPATTGLMRHSRLIRAAPRCSPRYTQPRQASVCRKSSGIGPRHLVRRGRRERRQSNREDARRSRLVPPMRLLRLRQRPEMPRGLPATASQDTAAGEAAVASRVRLTALVQSPASASLSPRLVRGLRATCGPLPQPGALRGPGQNAG